MSYSLTEMREELRAHIDGHPGGGDDIGLPTIWDGEIPASVGNPAYFGFTLGGISTEVNLEKADYPGLRAIRRPNGVVILYQDLPPTYINTATPTLAGGGMGQTGMGPGITDVANHSILVPVSVTDMTYKISAQMSLVQRSAIGDVVGTIREGSTVLGEFARSKLGPDGQMLASGFTIVSPSVGNHTYKLSVQTSAGTVDKMATQGWILVENIGDTALTNPERLDLLY